MCIRDRFYTYATTFLNFLKFSRILIFKFQENFQETLVQKCKSVFPDISRYTCLLYTSCDGNFLLVGSTFSEEHISFVHHQFFTDWSYLRTESSNFEAS